jgi:uncharacterized coiled-coil protein SlyX
MTIDNAMQMYLLQQSNKERLSTLEQQVTKQAHIIETFKPYVPHGIVQQLLGV